MISASVAHRHRKHVPGLHRKDFKERIGEIRAISDGAEILARRKDHISRINRWYGNWGVTRSSGRLRIDPSEPLAITRYEKIYDAVRRIPRGKVATYGQIARIVGRCTARMVGYAMAALRGRTDVPWQRVINAKGEISTRSRGDGALRQRKLLEKEGIRFDPRGRVNLRKVRWKDSSF